MVSSPVAALKAHAVVWSARVAAMVGHCSVRLPPSTGSSHAVGHHLFEDASKPGWVAGWPASGRCGAGQECAFRA